MSPFRELFVEVAEALLEGAVRQAERPKVETYVAPSRTWFVLRAIEDASPCWPRVMVMQERLATARESRIVVRCQSCKRHSSFVESETRLELEEIADSVQRIARKIHAFTEQHEECGKGGSV